MKISSGHVRINMGLGDPEKYLEQVLEPFSYQIVDREIEVEIKKLIKHDKFELDWSLYQLTMFNIIQNAVKYNEEKGKIDISLKLVQLRDRSFMPNGMRDFIFSTTIANTGSEISKERIPHMMKLFGELKQKQSLHKVKDKGLGVGLTCSKVILTAMGGDIKILENE